MRSVSTRGDVRRACPFASAGWLACVILYWGVSPLRAAAPPENTPIDTEILKLIADETRINQLASCQAAAGINLDAIKANDLLNRHPVHDLRGRVNLGMLDRPRFLKDAPAALRAYQADIEKMLGDKLATARELMNDPMRQAILFNLLLSDAVRELHLPLSQDKVRVSLGRRLQPLLDENNQRDSARRVAAARAQDKPPADETPAQAEIRARVAAHHKAQGQMPPERDEAWLAREREESIALVMKQLSAEQQRRLIAGWTAAFPDGPPAPEPVASDSRPDAPAPRAVGPTAPRPAAVRPTPGAGVAAPRPVAVTPTPAAKPGDWVDLMRGLDVPQQAINGTWQVSDGVLTGNNGKLLLPLAPTGGFELDFAFNRSEGNKEFCVLFPAGSHDTQLWIGGARGQTSSIASVEGGKAAGGQKLVNGKDYHLTLTVKLDGANADIAVLLDGQPYMAWQGPRDQLKVGPQYKLRHRGALGLAVHGGVTVQFGGLKIRPLSGTLEPVAK